MDNTHLEKMFDLVVHMREKPETNYTLIGAKKNKIVLDYKQQGLVLNKSIQAFFQGSGKIQNEKIIQAFSGSSDLPKLTKDVFNVTMATPEYDTLWQQSFKGIPLKKGQLNWEIADVASGLTFNLVPEGGKAKFYGVSGNKVTVGIEKYGAGLGVTWEMVEGRKLYQFVDQMNIVKARLNELWAGIHYGLLATAGASHQVAYQSGTTTLEKDIATINHAYTTMGALLKSKGYGDTANAPVILYFSPTLKARMNQALKAVQSNIVQSGKTSAGAVVFNVNLATTWNSAVPANKAIMVFPGQKIQNSMYMQEMGLSERDISTLSELKTYWSAFGATVADTEQCSEVAFS